MTYTFEGEVNARGYEDGQGRSVFSHGDQYIGDWKNGDAACVADRTAARASDFTICTRLTAGYSGKQDGHGTFRYADGTVHSGMYKNGHRHGPGTFKFADGAEHHGEYRNDCMCVRPASLPCLPAARLCSHFSSRHGWGTLKHSNGNVYTGEFFNGMQHGRGTLVYADGRREDGEFKNDVFVVPAFPHAEK